MSASDIVAIIRTTRDRAECIFELELTGGYSVEDGVAQVECIVTQNGARIWADVVSPMGVIMLRPPVAGEVGVGFAPLGDQSNVYFLGYVPLNVADDAAPANELSFLLGVGSGWRVKTQAGTITLEATSEAAGVETTSTLTLYPDGRFEVATSAGSFVRGGAGGTLDLGGTAGSLVQIVADLITAITTATVPQLNPGAVSAVVNPQFALLLTQLTTLKG